MSVNQNGEIQNVPVLRKRYKTFQEAFSALPESTRQHCVRVAEYTKVLYAEAIAVEMRMGNASATAQLKPEYERAAYLCGLYHDIGKAFVPEHYHREDEEYSPEEIALYRKHTVDGAAMVDNTDFGEPLTAMEKRMIREALEFHHQKPDGSGFPEARSEREIRVMPLLVGFANHLDFWVTRRRSETPYDDVMKEILASFPEDTESELKFLLDECATKLRRVFAKYQDQSLRIPTVPPFVKRRANRAFELKYRPILHRERLETVALEARMYFKDNKETYLDFDDVRHIINKNKLVADIGRYFIYEASDMMKRIETCEIPIEYIVLDLMPTYYSQPKIIAAMQQQIEDGRVTPGKVLFGLEETMFELPSKAFMANVERMSELGFPIFLRGWKGEILPLEEVKKYSIKKIALHTDMYERLDIKEVQDTIDLLQAHGIEVLAGDYELSKYNDTLDALDIQSMTGILAGDYTTEDQVIVGELNLLRVKRGEKTLAQKQPSVKTQTVTGAAAEVQPETAETPKMEATEEDEADIRLESPESAKK